MESVSEVYTAQEWLDYKAWLKNLASQVSKSRGIFSVPPVVTLPTAAQVFALQEAVEAHATQLFAADPDLKDRKTCKAIRWVFARLVD